MKTSLTSFIALSLTLGAISVCPALETPVKPQIESVGLFKNGIAIVTASFPAKEPGTYLWDDVPRAVHGTFWVESNAQVAVQTTTRMIEKTDEGETSTGSLQQDLAGKAVSIRLRAVGDTPGGLATGKVWALPDPLPLTKSWDRAYQSTDANGGYSNWYYYQQQQQKQTQQQPNTAGTFLILDRGDKREYVDLSSIASLEVAGPFMPKTMKEEKPVMLFHVSKPDAASGVVRVSYLAKGMAWAPSYQLDLSDGSKLLIRQNAIVRNELMEIKDTELKLISGFPNIRFAHVDSPMWPGQSLATFFQQASRQGTGANNLMTQQAIYHNSRSNESAPVPDASEEGNNSGDIHYESIGKHTMAAGDSLAQDVASGRADYKRVVEWKMADLRDAWGRPTRQDPSNLSDDNEPWDAVQFDNPLKFPMTTASATVVKDGKFLGQSQTGWTNPGQQACLRVTKALSVSAKNQEFEMEGAREEVAYMGNRYRKTKVKGTMELRNYRTAEITFVARMEYYGEFIAAEGEPAKRLLPEGIGSVNAKRELEWTLKLAPGESKTITYSYSVLVGI